MASEPLLPPNTTHVMQSYFIRAKWDHGVYLHKHEIVNDYVYRNGIIGAAVWGKVDGTAFIKKAAKQWGHTDLELVPTIEVALVSLN